MPDDSADQTFEELQDIVQQAILREFPNPERKGCPGPEVLRELANRPRPTRDTPWEHVTHCSPCYQEFLDLRVRVKERREAEHRRAMVRRGGVIGLALLVLAGLFGGYRLLQRLGGSPDGHYLSASLDLKDRSVTRGGGQAPQPHPLVLPATRLDLTIYLPIGTEAGQYEVQLLKKIDEPILKVTGAATIERGITVLRAKLDLTSQGSGSFLIGLRQADSEWTYYPLTVR
jgi:hypothetical protein